MKIFKSKIFYIILIVIFTLILAATLVIRFALPSGRSSFGSDFGTPPAFSTDSEGKPDFSNMPDFSGDSEKGDLPENFELPSDIEKPEKSEKSDDSEDKNTSGDDSSSDKKRPSGSFPGGRPGSRNSGFTGTVRKIWIPIVIVCVIVDAFSVFMLIRISKKKNGKDNSGSSSSGDDTDDGSIKNRKPLLFLLVIPVLVLAIVLNMIPKQGSGTTSSVEVKEDVITAEAASKELKTVFLSGGTLSDSDKVSVTLPGDVEITSYAVSNGDTVKEGDFIATVNKTSLMNQISEIKDLISDLDEELAMSKEDDDYKTITSPAEGRVMAIYAEKGVSVSDTVASNSALILLSLDGLMKVEIDKVDGLSVGDSVKVRLSDSTEKTGRVAELSEDKISVTLSDKKTKLGDKAEVISEDGQTIGSGELQINSCLKITGYQGMVNKISVKEGEYVEAGDDLIKLVSKVHSTDYTELKSQRKTLTEQLNKLFSIYESGKIYAEASGTISDLDEDIPVEGTGTTAVCYSLAATTVDLFSEVYDMFLSAAPKAEKDSKQADTAKTKDSKDTKTTKDTKDSGSDKKTTDTTDKKTDADQTKPSGVNPGNMQDPTKQQGDQNKPSGSGSPSNVSMPDSAKTQASTDTTAQATTQQDQTTTDEGSEYEVEEKEIYQILPTDSMSIEISVDELDIINIKKGQAATVSLDALPGQSFEGKISSVANEGTYDSGNSKYNVTVVIDRTEQMYSGMNAGIRIETKEPAGCLTVPAAAICDEDGKTWVYTSYDEENDELIGLTEVVTGRSDGEYVEIVSGIKTGDKVCYRYADTIEYNFVRRS